MSVIVAAQSPLQLQSIPLCTSAKIKDPQGKLVAVGAFVRYHPNQAYFILQHLDTSIADKAVTVVSADDVQNPLDMRISACFDQHPNRTFLPMYIQVHFNPEERLVLEHLVDKLAERTLGLTNLELKRNLTIDVFDTDKNAFLRDNAGFFVADRMRLQQITISTVEALGALKACKDVSVSRASGDIFPELINYDATLSNHKRTEFLEFLFKENLVYVANWTSAKKSEDTRTSASNVKTRAIEKETKEEAEEMACTTAGYLVAPKPKSNDRKQSVMCVYADNQLVADTLLAKYIRDVKSTHQIERVSICCAANNWPALRPLASLKIRPIYRRHTRAVPEKIKFERIFGLNVGMNIF